MWIQLRHQKSTALDINNELLQRGDTVEKTLERVTRYGGKVNERLIIEDIYTMPDFYATEIFGALKYVDRSGWIVNSQLNLYRKVNDE